jgi:hypothetical protein
MLKFRHIAKPYKPSAELKGDTWQYLQYNFIEQKDQYAGKKLSVLLKDLEFDIKFFIKVFLTTMLLKVIKQLYVTGFLFDQPFSEIELRKIKDVYGFNWTKHPYDFFKNQVVKNTWVIARL